MADTILTKLADLIDPEVMADMISAKIPDKIRVAPFAKVDDTLAGVPGDTITVPSYGYIGDAEDVAEGVDVDIDKMSTKDKFLSTLSLRRATTCGMAVTTTFPISIHALLAESDLRARAPE